MTCEKANTKIEEQFERDDGSALVSLDSFALGHGQPVDRWYSVSVTWSPQVAPPRVTEMWVMK